MYLVYKCSISRDFFGGGRKKSVEEMYSPQTFCGANTDIGTTHNKGDHYDDEKILPAISAKDNQIIL